MGTELTKISDFYNIITGDNAGESMKKWKESISEKLDYPDELRIVERFIGNLFTNQIIILSGPPGTGKTSLPFAVAEAIGASCKLIPVQPNWTDQQDLMGYYNPLKNDNRGGYTTTPFLDELIEADKDETIRFVVLDEMNLAHVEYYFSTMLSAMETEEKEISLYSEKISGGKDEISPTIKIPKNLQIIGTLNMDETTKGISPKVIDRSYILEIPAKAETSGGNPDAVSKDGFDALKESVEGILPVSLSHRLKKQYETMAERTFLYNDDFVVGKVLPMIRDKKVGESQIDALDKNIYPISCEKLERMKSDTSDENTVKLDFWGTD